MAEIVRDFMKKLSNLFTYYLSDHHLGTPLREVVGSRALNEKFLDVERGILKELSAQTGSRRFERIYHIVRLHTSYEGIKKDWSANKNITKTFTGFTQPIVNERGNNPMQIDVKYLFMSQQTDAIMKAAEVCEKTGR